MSKYKFMQNKPAKISKICINLLLLLLAIAVLLQPQHSVLAVRSGLKLWYEVIVPSLLPFFIISNLLVALGAAEAAGQVLSPLMRPLFNLPGSAALAVLMGFCSGFPTGAAICAALRQKNLLSKEEAGRLVAFTNNAGPLYVTVAVAAGILRCPQAAALLALGHYGLNLLLGILLGIFSRGQTPALASEASTAVTPAIHPAAALKEAALKAAGNMVLIGCYMALFSLAAALLTSLLPQGWPVLAQAGISGALEMSLGMDALQQSTGDASQVLPAAAAILAFGGLSVQAQVLAMLQGTDISPQLYLLSRPLHAVAAYGLTAWVVGNASLPTASLPGQPMAIAQPWLFSLTAALIISALWIGLALRNNN